MDSQESSPTLQFKSINSLALSLLYDPTLPSIHDCRKNHHFDYMDLCRQSNVSAFCHSFSSKEQASCSFMAAVTICSDFGAQENETRKWEKISSRKLAFWGSLYSLASLPTPASMITSLPFSASSNVFIKTPVITVDSPEYSRILLLSQYPLKIPFCHLRKHSEVLDDRIWHICVCRGDYSTYHSNKSVNDLIENWGVE